MKPLEGNEPSLGSAPVPPGAAPSPPPGLLQEDSEDLRQVIPPDMLPPLKLSEFISLTELESSWLTWQDEPIDVGDFYRNFNLPQVVKVDSGDYGNFGMGTHVDVQRPFLLFTARKCSKVLAANVYWDDSKQQYVEVGPRVVIPVNYPGN